MKNYLIPIVVPLVLAILMWLAASEKPEKIGDDSILLQYGKALKILGIGFPLIFLGFLIYVVIERPPKTIDDLQASIFLLCFPLPFLAYFYLEFFKVKIIINNQSISATTPWRGAREYHWSEIEEITYSPSFRWFRIRVKNNKPLYISAFISGANEFLNRMTQLLPKRVYQKALEKLE